MYQTRSWDRMPSTVKINRDTNMTSGKIRVRLVTATLFGSWLGLCGLSGCNHAKLTVADQGRDEVKDWVRTWHHMRYSPILAEARLARRRRATGVFSESLGEAGLLGEDATHPKDHTDYEAFTERLRFGSYSVLQRPARALLFHEGVPVWAGEHVLPLRTKGRVYALCLLTAMPQESRRHISAVFDPLWILPDVPDSSGITPRITNAVPAYIRVRKCDNWMTDIDGDGTDELVVLEPMGMDGSWTPFSCLTKVRWVLCLYGKRTGGSLPPPNKLLEVPLPFGVMGGHLTLKRQTEPQRGLVVWDGSVPDVSVESPRRLGTIMHAPKTEKWKFVEHTKDAAP